MGRLDKLYKADVSHRAVAVYLYLADRANKEGHAGRLFPRLPVN